MKSKINITGVSETMLQTLYVRAKETNSQNAKIKDDIAVHIVENIDYDFSKADKDSAMSSGAVSYTHLDVYKRQDPRNTSKIGKEKYTKIKGLSVHYCAAYVINRRGMGFVD